VHPEGPASGHLDRSFSGFLCLQANAEMIPSSRLLLRRFSCTPLPAFRSIKFKSCLLQRSANYTIRHEFRESEPCGACLKPLLLTLVTSSLPHSPYQKGERAKPGNLLTKWCSFSTPLRNNGSFISLVIFPFYLLYSYYLYSLFKPLVEPSCAQHAFPKLS
jgi:hypothetical protein